MTAFARKNRSRRRTIPYQRQGSRSRESDSHASNDGNRSAEGTTDKIISSAAQKAPQTRGGHQNPSAWPFKPTPTTGPAKEKRRELTPDEGKSGPPDGKVRGEGPPVDRSISSRTVCPSHFERTTFSNPQLARILSFPPNMSIVVAPFSVAPQAFAISQRWQPALSQHGFEFVDQQHGTPTRVVLRLFAELGPRRRRSEEVQRFLEICGELCAARHRPILIEIEYGITS